MIRLSRIDNLFCAFLVILWGTLLMSCANIQPLTGGEKDETPPSVDWSASTANMQTNFYPKKIELTFDEWVQIKDAYSQVLVSPPLSPSPSLALKGHTVVVTLPESDTLVDNTTYTINFGNAIRDITESNPAQDITFIFSTGDYLDSLSLAGNVSNAYDRTPNETSTVLLYKDLTDTIISKGRPFYITKVDNEGNYQFQNLAQGTYQLIALQEADNNLRYDKPDEGIAFLTETISISNTTRQAPDLSLSIDEPQLRVMKQSTLGPGTRVIRFNRVPYDIQLQGNNILAQRHEADSILFFVELEVDTSKWTFQGQRGITDTLNLLKEARRPIVSMDTVAIEQNIFSAFRQNLALVQTVLPSDTPTIKCPIPMRWLDSTVIEVEIDSVWQHSPTAHWHWQDPFTLKYVPPNLSKTGHFRFLPSAFQSYYGVPNRDTLHFRYKIESTDKLSSLSLALSGLKAQQPYIIELFKGNQKASIHHAFRPSDSTHLVELNNIQPGQYSARIIMDKNQDNRWTPGRYPNRAPEPTSILTLQLLRPDWKLEADWLIEF